MENALKSLLKNSSWNESKICFKLRLFEDAGIELLDLCFRIEFEFFLVDSPLP